MDEKKNISNILVRCIFEHRTITSFTHLITPEDGRILPKHIQLYERSN